MRCGHIPLADRGPFENLTEAEVGCLICGAMGQYDSKIPTVALQRIGRP
jgi:hypothetical protein